MKVTGNNRISLFIILLIAIIWVRVFGTIKVWQTPQGVINNDVISYYAYLPAAFIYKDISLNFYYDSAFNHRDKLWPERSPNGSLVIKTSMGLSMMYLPFFAIAHLYTKASGFPADGYGSYYQIALLLSSIFYALTGLYFLRRILLLYFSDAVTSLSLLSVALGTNLYNYVTTEACMSHAYSFCLIVIFIWLTIQWHKHPGIKNIVLLGLIGGLIALIRPTNILVWIIFFLYDIKRPNDMIDKCRLYWRKKWLVLLAGCLFFIIWLPQLTYWKYVTGQWTFFSYVGERFFFGHPHITDGLFGYRKGWLLYTPVMIFGVLGIASLRKKVPALFTGTLVFFFLSTYIILSWWSWWYGGGFGNRAFIDMYGLLAIPMATVINICISKQFLGRLITGSMMMVLITFQLFQSLQYRTGSIHWDSMSREAYWASFMKKYPPPGWHYLLSPPDYEKARKFGREDI